MFNVVVHEHSATTAHLVLPLLPVLSEAELKKVAGSVSWDDLKVEDTSV